MANERTFLSWIRTAMTLVTFSIGFLQIYRLDMKSNNKVIDETTGEEYDIGDKANKVYQSLAKPISTLCIVLGILGCIFGLIRYFQVQFLLIRNYFPATRLFIIILIIINLAMLILLILLDIKLTI
ncbi:hypothetical protein DFJ63DRAFT_320505 [Scheffersomyces coipomensis]|uniref:uncharacterized protein n=1 Tax=Scheffersomyces coipomensis TaxID=1788519 RepID=UPI00315E02CB